MSEISVGGDTVAETEHRDQGAIYGDPCICPPGDQGDGAETGTASNEDRECFTITEMAPLRAFSLLKVLSSAFTFKRS